MPSSRAFFILVISVIASLVAGSPANPVSVIPPGGAPVQAVGGLTLSLSTSGYHFTPLIGSLIRPNPVKFTVVPLPRQGVVVSASLMNRTPEDITFQFPTTVAAAAHFVFRVYNSDGTLVWDSSAGVIAPDHVTDATLKAHRAWHSSAFVPLFIDNTPLPAGTYTVVAKLETLPGTVEFSSTASFIVNNVIAF